MSKSIREPGAGVAAGRGSITVLSGERVEASELSVAFFAAGTKQTISQASYHICILTKSTFIMEKSPETNLSASLETISL